MVPRVTSVSGCMRGAPRSSPVVPQCCFLLRGCTVPSGAQARTGKPRILSPFPPTPNMQPGPGISSSKSPHCCCRALVWPPSSPPDSVHSLLPVSPPPRHSLLPVARGIFLKAHLVTSLHATNPSGTPCGLQDKVPPLREWRVRFFTSCPCPPRVPPARPHTCPVLRSYPAPCSLRRAPCLWTCCSFCLGFPCLPGEQVLQDSNSTFKKTALPFPCLALVPLPCPWSPGLCTSIPVGLFPTRACVSPLLASTKPSSSEGRDSLSLRPPLHPVPCPLGALGGWCAGGWVSADKGGSKAGPVWCEVWWSGPGRVVLSANWWV